MKMLHCVHVMKMDVLLTVAANREINGLLRIQQESADMIGRMTRMRQK
jgi:hypothetical protein